MSAPAPAAVVRLQRQRELALRTMAAAEALWQSIDGRHVNGSWRSIADRMLALLLTAQRVSVAGAQDYVDQAVDELGGTSDPAGSVNPDAWTGTAADGRPIVSLLDLPRRTTLTSLAAGMPQGQALAAGRGQLLRIMSSEVEDTGRSAAGVRMVSNRGCTGYVRVISPGACARCAVLAGVVYHTQTAFLRHPHCHCGQQPTVLGQQSRALTSPDQYFRSLSPQEQDRIFTAAGARAIRDGADIGQVVNARRRGSMYTATAYGHRVSATREGTTRRGEFFRQERARAVAAGQTTRSAFRLRTPRLMPEAIYEIAQSRDEAISMLRRFGFLF